MPFGAGGGVRVCRGSSTTQGTCAKRASPCSAQDDNGRGARGVSCGDLVMTMIEVEKVLGSVAAQLMNGEVVLLEGRKIPVERVGRGRLRMVQFRLNGRVLEAQWGEAGAGEASGGAVSECGDASVCGGVGGWGSAGVWEVRVPSAQYLVPSCELRVQVVRASMSGLKTPDLFADFCTRR
jgi:hypothetical protein